MTTNPADRSTIPVVDVDQVFPAMPETGSLIRSATSLDQTPAVRAAIRDVLGIRSRTEDPKAFTDALAATFRLDLVEGHIEATYVPRGYAVQADLGAVTGGQASLYRRAQIARTEALRILDGLVPLRTDGDRDDMDAYRTIVRNALQSLVDEMGSPGGPRVGMVNSYFDGLTGGQPVLDPDTVGGQLGALRERFGLIDDNVNTIEEEGIRTAYWTLADMVDNLRQAWIAERVRFSGTSGLGFLGTDLILLSRLMEAAADQVHELGSVLDSVLIPATERRTITLDDTTNLTLDGLLTWLESFLSDEGRRLAQDAGRDGIVAGLAPTAAALYETFRHLLADPCGCDERMLETEDECCPVRYLPTSCCERWPAGMWSARVRVAVASLCRLLRELAQRAQRVGRWAGVVLVDVTVSLLDRGIDDTTRTPVVNVEFRGLNLRPTYMPALVPLDRRFTKDDCRLEDVDIAGLVLPLPGSATADDESVSALFRVEDVEPIMGEADIWVTTEGVVVPASDVPIAVIDTETGRVVHAPTPTTWPKLYAARTPRTAKSAWHGRATPPPPQPPQGAGALARQRPLVSPRLDLQWAAQEQLFQRPRPTVTAAAAFALLPQEIPVLIGRLEAEEQALTGRIDDTGPDDEAKAGKTRLQKEITDLRKQQAAAPADKQADFDTQIAALEAKKEAAQNEVARLGEVRKEDRARKKTVKEQRAKLRAADKHRTGLESFVTDDLTAIRAGEPGPGTEGGK